MAQSKIALINSSQAIFIPLIFDKVSVDAAFLNFHARSVPSREWLAAMGLFICARKKYRGTIQIPIRHVLRKGGYQLMNALSNIVLFKRHFYFYHYGIICPIGNDLNSEIRGCLDAMEKFGIASSIIVTFEQEENLLIHGKSIEVLPFYKAFS